MHQLEVRGLARCPLRRARNGIQHHGAPRGADLAAERLDDLGQAQRSLADRRQRIWHEVGDHRARTDRVSLAPDEHTVAVAVLEHAVRAAREAHVHAELLAARDERVGEAAEATTNVARAAVVVVHRAERERRLRLGGGALHGDLAERVEVDAQRLVLGELVAREHGREGAPDEAEQWHVAGGARGVSEDRGEIERRKTRRIIEDLPEQVCHAPLVIEERAHAVGLLRAARGELRHERLTIAPHDELEARCAHRDEGIGALDLHLRRVLREPAPEELVGREGRSRRWRPRRSGMHARAPARRARSW